MNPNSAARSGRVRRPRWIGPALALAAYLGLTVLFYLPAWLDPLRRTVGSGLDTANTVWFMRWVGWAVTHGHNPLVTTYMYYPFGVNVMWNNADALPLAGLVTIPLQLTLGAVFAYNVAVTLGFAASMWCAYLAIRRHVPGELGPAIGALVYGFSGYMVAQGVGHLGLTMAFVPPLMLMLLEDIFISQNGSPWRQGALLGVLAAVQAGLAEELLATEAVAALVLLAVLAVMFPRRAVASLPHATRALAAALAVTLVLTAPALYYQFRGPQRLAGAIRDIKIWSNDLGNFVEPTLLQLVHPLGIQGQGYLGNPTEWNAYLGLPLLVLAALTAFVLYRRVDLRVALIAGAVIAVLSLGPVVHLHGQPTSLPGIWRAGRVPLLQNVLPARLMLYGALAVAWLTAAFVQRLSVARPAPRLAGWGLVALSLVALAPAWPGFTEPRQGATRFDLAAHPGLRGGVVLAFPIPMGDHLNFTYATDPLLWQAYSDFAFKEVDVSAIVPGPDRKQTLDYNLPLLAAPVVAIQDGRPPAPLERAQVLADLRARKVDAVLLGPMPQRDAARAYIEGLLGPGQEEDGIVVWRIPR